MDVNEFCAVLRQHVLANHQWNIKEENFRIYLDGFTSDDPKDLRMIRNTNIKYAHAESDVLIGDYLILAFDAETGNNICRFELSYLMKEYEAQNWEWVMKIIDENIKQMRSIDSDSFIKNINNYDLIKEQLIIRPLNFTDNRYELKDTIYKKYGDIALVLYLKLYDNEEMGLGTTKISTSLLESWNKELEEVWEVALLNSNIMAPPRMYMNIGELTHCNYNMGAFMSLNSPISHIEKFQTPLVTTTRQINGAIALFYPGVMDKIGELFGGDYYVAFTSIHESRVHHIDSVPPRQILQNIKATNRNFCQNEVLSRKVYRYDCSKKELIMLEL